MLSASLSEAVLSLLLPTEEVGGKRNLLQLLHQDVSIPWGDTRGLTLQRQCTIHV